MTAARPGPQLRRAARRRALAPAALCGGLLAGLLLAAAPAPAPAQSGPDAFAPAAFVDGKAVTNFDVEQRARLLKFTNVTPDLDRETAMDSVIDDRLKRRAADNAGLSVNREDVDRGLARFAEAQGLSSPAALESRLKAAGISLAVVRDYIEVELMWTSMIRREFSPRVEVTELELDEEIAASGLDRAVEFNMAEIAIAARGDPDAAMARAREAVAKIRGGEDFGAVARRYSQSPSAPKGGSLGWVPAERLPGPLRAQFMSMQPGGVTDPFPVQGGVAALGMLERREKEREITAEDRERLRQQLMEQRLQRQAEGRLLEMRARAYVERR